LFCSFAPKAKSDWDASAYKNWTVSSVTIEGLNDELASELKNGLALAVPKGLLKTRRSRFFPQTLDADIKRALLFLARKGYPYATVTPRLVPHSKRKRVQLVLDVESGPAVRIESIEITGMPAELEASAVKTLKVARDSVVVDERIERSKVALLELLGNSGFARASVESRIQWVDSTRIELRFDVLAGAEYYFGDVIITGASDDLIPLTRKVVTARRGARYEPKILDESQKNLRVLDLFRRIRMDVRDTAADTLACAVEVTMKAPRRLETTLRYWTDEKLDGSIMWKHRNLFKRGRGGSVLLSASFIRQKAELSAWWPAVLMARSRGTLSAGVENEIEESYDLLSVGGSIGLNYDFSLRTRIRIALVFSDIDVSEKTPDADVLETQDGTLNSIQLRWEHNASNHPILPTSGTYTYVDVEWAPDGPLNDYRFFSVSPTGIIYLPLSRSQNWVLASRATIGAAWPLGDMIELLPNRRFYSGGATSMRGFQRRKLGPLDSNEAPLGGEAKLETSAELRFPLFSILRGTWFVDSGQVWPYADSITFDRYEVAAGFGLWINTVIGPLRGDLAYRLTDYEKTQPRWAFHFSIGPAF
jgi:outer membrane protein insertion porin family